VYIFAHSFHWWNLLCFKLGWNCENNPVIDVIVLTLVSTTSFKILMLKEMNSWLQLHIEVNPINTVR